MPNDWALFEPPDRLSPLPEGPLMAFLRLHTDSPVRISLRHQRRADSRVLQVLLCAGIAWRARGFGFDVADLPPNLIRDFAHLGLNTENSGWSSLP